MSELQEISKLQDYVNHHILGQETLVNRMLIALLADGHILVEGAPGLAKTSAIKILARGIDGEFHRIQFTPDLLPADLTGTEVFQPQKASFKFQKGPLFHNFILADEINRSPAKVQSALLEAMGEGQITIGRTTYPLDELFLVMATQNPIEQVGTYPLPEAQRDRFLLHVKVDYPDIKTEQQILQLVLNQKQQPNLILKESPHLSRETILAARQAVLSVHLANELEMYMVQLVTATRKPEIYDHKLNEWVAYGASPRGTIALALASRAHAWLAGRDYVSPEDIQQIAADVLRHRIVLSYDAEADGISSDDVISKIIKAVAVP
jgi:MoxR-like ATPase